MKNYNVSILEEMRNGSLNRLVNEILTYHKSKALRSFREYNENSFHNALEVMLSNFSINYLSELQLIMNIRNKDITYGFPDLCLFDPKGEEFVVIEMKLFNLIGLYSGYRNNNKPVWEHHPEHISLFNFDKMIMDDTEENLLNKNYVYWSKSEGLSTRIKSIIEKGYEQLNKYCKVIVKGKGSNSDGVIDKRISIETGLSNIRGFLIASFDSQRVIIRSKVRSSYFQYFFNKIDE